MNPFQCLTKAVSLNPREQWSVAKNICCLRKIIIEIIIIIIIKNARQHFEKVGVLFYCCCCIAVASRWLKGRWRNTCCRERLKWFRHKPSEIPNSSHHHTPLSYLPYCHLSPLSDSIKSYLKAITKHLLVSVPVFPLPFSVIILIPIGMKKYQCFSRHWETSADCAGCHSTLATPAQIQWTLGSWAPQQ